MKLWECFECGVRCSTTPGALGIVCTCPSLDLPASRVVQMVDVTDRNPDEWFIRAVPENMAVL